MKRDEAMAKVGKLREQAGAANNVQELKVAVLGILDLLSADEEKDDEKAKAQVKHAPSHGHAAKTDKD